MRNAVLFICSTFLVGYACSSNHWTVTDDGLTIQSIVSFFFYFGLIIVFLATKCYQVFGSYEEFEWLLYGSLQLLLVE